MPNRTTKELLAASHVMIAPGTFAVISLTDDQWRTLLANPELSPRMTAPFLILKDAFEVTLIVDETDSRLLEVAIAGARIESGFRMLTFDVKLDFSVVGFLSEVTSVLAAAGVPILAISSFSRDHLFIRQEYLAKALNALSPVVADLC